MFPVALLGAIARSLLRLSVMDVVGVFTVHGSCLDGRPPCHSVLASHPLNDWLRFMVSESSKVMDKTS